MNLIEIMGFYCHFFINSTRPLFNKIVVIDGNIADTILIKAGGDNDP